jgi:phosphogluconate dehydratase
MIDERAFVNGVVGLHATGGSTNHTIHLIAMAAAAGIASPGTTSPTSPMSCRCCARVYPNGSADVNHFHAAGGMQFLIRDLLDAGLLHEDVKTVWGSGPAPLRPSSRSSTRPATARFRLACSRARAATTTC